MANYRTSCDGCGVSLFGTDGVELGHGSYCEFCSQDYLGPEERADAWCEG